MGEPARPLHLLHKLIEDSPRLSSPTKEIYRRTVEEWLLFAGDQPAQWTPLKAQEFYNRMLANASPSTANKLLYGLRYASRRYATIHNDPRLDFAASVETAATKAETRPEKALSVSKAIALFEAAKGDTPVDLRDRALLAFALATGMRRTSLAAVPVIPISIDQANGSYFTEVPIRGGRQYRVPIAPAIVPVIQPYAKWLAQFRVETGVFFRRINKTVHGYRPGLGFSKDGWAVWSIVESIGDRIGLAVTPDVFRHTLVAWMTAAAVPPHLISLVLGQRDIGLTHDADWSSLRRDAATAIDLLIKPVLGSS